MNLLDENFPEDQLPLLKECRVPFRRLGFDVARLGIKDADILPLLHALRRVTFFTQDKDFFRSALCHSAYGLVWLDVDADDTALHVRRLLRHPRFGTGARRMGLVLRAHPGGVHFWSRHRGPLERVAWVD